MVKATETSGEPSLTRLHDDLCRLQGHLFQTRLGLEGIVCEAFYNLGRPSGYFIFSLIGLKRTLFTNNFSEALKGEPVVYSSPCGHALGKGCYSVTQYCFFFENRRDS